MFKNSFGKNYMNDFFEVFQNAKDIDDKEAMKQAFFEARKRIKDYVHYASEQVLKDLAYEYLSNKSLNITCALDSKEAKGWIPTEQISRFMQQALKVCNSRVPWKIKRRKNV